MENAPSARHAASQEFEAWSRAIRFGLLLLAFALLHAPSLAYGQTTSSTRQGRLLGAELRVSPYLGRAVPTASLLFYSGSRDVSFGGELSVTLRSITDQRPNGYRRMGPLVRIGPSVEYAGLLSTQTGYYTAFAILVGITKIEERSHDVITSAPDFATGLTPKAGLFWEPSPDLQVRVGTSLWIGRMPWNRDIRLLPALTASVLL